MFLNVNVGSGPIKRRQLAGAMEKPCCGASVTWGPVAARRDPAFSVSRASREPL